MSSIVLDLQQAAMDSGGEVDTLLRKALVIAAKLKLKDSLTWINHELKGYDSEAGLPKYRQIAGELKCPNPYNGIMMPMIWKGGMPEFIASMPILQPIGEIQETLKKNEMGTMTIPIHPDGVAELMRIFKAPSAPIYVINKISVFGILNAVRNAILEWTLKLEEDGILGEGMAFSLVETKTAMNQTYNITNFAGVIGNVNGSQLQIGDYGQIHSELKALKIPQSERNELENVMEAVQKAPPEKKAGLIAQGMSWIVKHGDKLGALSDALRHWFDGQSA